MRDKVAKVVWTRQAREALKAILDYRYTKNPTARKIVRKDILEASKNIIYTKQYQRDTIAPEYRRIIVRDYKIIYKTTPETVIVLNVVCTKAK